MMSTQKKVSFDRDICFVDLDTGNCNTSVIRPVRFREFMYKVKSHVRRGTLSPEYMMHRCVVSRTNAHIDPPLLAEYMIRFLLQKISLMGLRPNTSVGSVKLTKEDIIDIIACLRHCTQQKYLNSVKTITL